MAQSLREIGEDLRHAREALELTQQRVADLCGMTAEAVAECECGECRDVLLLSRYGSLVGVLWVLPVQYATA